MIEKCINFDTKKGGRKDCDGKLLVDGWLHLQQCVRALDLAVGEEDRTVVPWCLLWKRRRKRRDQ